MPAFVFVSLPKVTHLQIIEKCWSFCFLLGTTMFVFSIAQSCKHSSVFLMITFLLLCLGFLVFFLVSLFKYLAVSEVSKQFICMQLSSATLSCTVMLIFTFTQCWH